ncbi:MAG: polyprenyl synthetase family protein [Deltaproteobacteria bacterium]|nr:polyprenyl synthetase family protein [Deltaproteobacteria bacterium]
MSSFDLSSYLSSKREQINKTLSSIFSDTSSKIVKAMKYSLMGGGKRIRPILCIAAAETVGGQSQDVIRAACALEMIHTYSLIHDDLPAMDNDKLRRGQPTCHVAFDEATAILAGDALLTLAFEILSSMTFIQEDQLLNWMNVIHTISSAAGYRGMIEGQMQDMAGEARLLCLEDLENMHALKTGALIEASVTVGAILGKGSVDQIQRLKIYANHIGLAFQVTDDLLDVEGDPYVMGKDVGSDHSRSKSTFPALIGIEKSKQFAKKLVKNALKALDSFDNKAHPLRAIAYYVVERKK